MKRFIFILFCTSFYGAHSQTVYAEFDLESNKIDDIQAFQIDDSVFLTYTDQNIKKAFWIDADGETSSFSLNQILGIQIAAIQKNQDTTFLYYFREENKFLKLYSLSQPSTGGNFRPGKKPINLYHSEVIGLHADDKELILVCYTKSSNYIEIISVNRGVFINVFALEMPPDFGRYASSSGFLTNLELTGISQGAAPTKIYKEGPFIIFTIDEDRFNKGDKSTVIRIDRTTGNHTRHVLPGPDGDKFSSFYHGGKLFRLTSSNKNYQWFVYDIDSGRLLYTKKLEQEKSLRQQKVFLRTAESKEVWYSSLYDMMSWTSEPSIIVQNIKNSSDLRIVTGTFLNSKGATLGGGGTPLALLTSIVVSNIINQLEGRPGIIHYFSLRGNIENGFEIEPPEKNPDPSVRQTIDEYEISMTSGVPKGAEEWHWFLLYKGYLELTEGALGIYHEKRKEAKKLILIKYP